MSAKKELFRQFELDFPPISAIKESGGWLSPNGKFYPCGFCQHTKLAKKLALIYFDSQNGDTTLEDNGWAHVSYDASVLAISKRLSQAQLNNLMDIFSIAESIIYKTRLMRDINFYAETRD